MKIELPIFGLELKPKKKKENEEKCGHDKPAHVQSSQFWREV
jgi:hypothetical protein